MGEVLCHDAGEYGSLHFQGERAGFLVLAQVYLHSGLVQNAN